jgi:hypothetical protein
MKRSPAAIDRVPSEIRHGGDSQNDATNRTDRESSGKRDVDNDQVSEVAVTIADMAHVMDFIYNHRAPSLRPEDVAEIYGQLIWSLSDEAAAFLLQVREEWLISGDRGRVELALAIGEVFPFRDATRMAEVLGQVSTKWPDLRDRCESMIKERAVAERGGE